jgi:lipoprotein NlpI
MRSIRWMLEHSMRHAWVGVVTGALLAAAVAAEPGPDFYQRRGEEHFRAGRIAESIADFDKVIELQPASEPHHWQRGISHYYAGRFADGRRQFELHRTVNPHDVENAAWHYLCVARQQTPAAARQALIAIDTARDRRIPMKEVYELYAGRGSAQAVLDAAEQAPESRRSSALFYAHLYLGLHHEVHQRPDEAKRHLELAATKHAQDHYMGDVARVHWARVR